MIRDPRDVAVSRMGHGRRLGLLHALTPGTPGYLEAVDGAVTTWLEAVTRVDGFAAEHPGKVHEVRYLELHAEPVETMARLFGFLGVDVDPALLRRIAEATSFEAQTGRKPGEEDPRSFLRKGQPGDWRNRLDAASAGRICHACGPLMRAKGIATSEPA
jgi:hypothetical protein